MDYIVHGVIKSHKDRTSLLLSVIHNKCCSGGMHRVILNHKSAFDSDHLS